MNANKNFAKTQFEEYWDSINWENELKQCNNYEILPYFEKYIQKHNRILESGCGFGRWVKYYHLKGYDITGIDWSEKTIEQIKNNYGNLNVICSDIRHTIFEDNYFDIIISLATVQHAIEGPGEALKECYRLLKPNGILIITVPAITNFRKIFYFIKRPLQICKSFINYGVLGINSLVKLLRKGKPDLFLVYGKQNNLYYFFEYRFQKKTIEKYLQSESFEIIESKQTFNKDGLFNDLGKIVGSIGADGEIKLNSIGIMFSKLFPDSFCHHNFCIAKKVVIANLN